MYCRKTEGREHGPLHRVGLARFVRARMHRRIFAWFGASIVMSGAAAWVVLSLVAPDDSRWRDDWDRFRNFVGERYADVWDDPAARDRLGAEMAGDLRLDVRLVDDGGVTVANYGDRPCDEPRFVADVRTGPSAPLLGEVWICAAPGHHGRGWLMALAALGAACCVIWAASGMAARRLTAPLWDVARVARDIGDGRLGSRVQLPERHHIGEMGILAESVNDMASRIEKQLRDQKELLAAVSHELRTPLGHIRVILETMRDAPPGEGDVASKAKSDAEKQIDELEREVCEVDDLVGELLASSRLTFDTLAHRKLEALDVAARALERTGLDLSLLESQEESIAFEGDATLLGRALTNLLENAKRHGGGVAAMRIDATDDEVVFVVEDRGPGFSEIELQKVFDSFYRGDHRAGASHGSLGLGLSLVRRIAEAHGGRAWAENREGGGAKVGMRIARAKKPTSEPPRPSTGPRSV